jgi:hypothetical protein
MKILKYNLCTKINHGTEESPLWEDILTPVEMGWNEANEEIAKREAYNGEYSIEDDGEEEISEPSQLDRIEAQVFYTAMQTDTLITEV